MKIYLPQEYLDKRAKSAYVKDLVGTSKIIPRCGSILCYENSYMEENSNYIFVFTEHFGHRYWHKDELIDYISYKRQKINKAEQDF